MWVGKRKGKREFSSVEGKIAEERERFQVKSTDTAIFSAGEVLCRGISHWLRRGFRRLIRKAPARCKERVLRSLRWPTKS
jgi:hypothetical protein